MCGRYAFTKTDGKKLKERFKLSKVPEKLEPHYNIAPSQDVPAILNESPHEISMIRWGLIPHWAKEENTQYSMINAKAETLTERPAYRGPVRHKRCLILADSFYEWKLAPGRKSSGMRSLASHEKRQGGRADGKKSPYRIMMKDEGVFAFAGIWDLWGEKEKGIYSCSIITTESNRLLKGIHERMPVILPQDKEDAWLSEIGIEDVKRLLKPYDDKEMDAYEISTLVNSPKNDSADIFAPVDH
ncbi:MAG: SOS response-associated peptidase [Candidatus Omnitrophica bacterium]|nr:SOS response-associated peptidase [Candidatus Omnitrophota bacterium]